MLVFPNLLLCSLAQPIYLCPVDLHKLQRLCGFDIVQRYRNVSNNILPTELGF
jgi:hypothetical protein